MGSLDSPAMQHLIQARSAALENVALYPQVMPPILGLVSDNPSLELKRWVADFIAEALSSPTLATEERQKIALSVLSILKSFLESPEKDTQLMKSTIQASAGAYPLILRHIISHHHDSHIWQQMLAIKSFILRNMDSYAPGVRICCIKFIQRVVQTQSPGVIADPRRPEQNEISLALVPRDHPLIPPANLEAETSGLLDRILDILNDKSSDILLLTATINCLGSLIKSRATIAPRILNAILQSDPYIIARYPITTRVKIEFRSIERTIRALFMGIMKRQPNHPLRERMEMFIHRLAQSRVALLEEASRKRPAPGDPAIGMDPSKRQRLDIAAPIPQPALGPQQPISVAQLFTLTTDPSAQNFDVNLIPIDIVKRILVPILQGVDPARLQAAIHTVRTRYSAMMQAQVQAQAVATNATAQALAEDEDDYEPDYEPMEDAEQVQNRLEMEASTNLDAKISEAHLSLFNLPPASQLPKEELDKLTQTAMDCVFRRIDESSIAATPRQQKPGLNRLAASGNDRQAIITTFIRLITRPSAGLSSEDKAIVNGGSPGDHISVTQLQAVGERWRDQLLTYILHNWTQRMDVATTWLTEEWYNDMMCQQAYERDMKKGDLPPIPNFPKWTNRFLDKLSVFIGQEHANLLIRFVSEVPGLDADLLAKIKQLALDPERVTMTVKALQYLIMFRPPVREVCLDAMEDLWRNYDGAQAATSPILKKYRPTVIETAVVA